MISHFLRFVQDMIFLWVCVIIYNIEDDPSLISMYPYRIESSETDINAFYNALLSMFVRFGDLGNAWCTGLG